MNKITKIDKAACQRLRHVLAAALAPTAHQLGLKIEPGSATYDPAGLVTFKVRIEVDGFDLAKHEWDQNCWAFSLQPEHYGAEVVYAGRRFKLVALKPRSPKWPVIGEALEGPDGGKRFKLPDTSIARLAAGKAA